MLPAIRGVIDRRLLVNYRVDAEAMDDGLPERFRPKTVAGYAVGGICLIRLRNLRPRGVPAVVGTGSENAAHRIAVEFEDDDGDEREGVFIPRRDTNSRLNTLLGGRLFPGVHHRASFAVDERDGYEVTMESADGETRVHVAGHTADELPGESVFDSVTAASRFFEAGSLGYSPRGDGYEGLELHTFEWDVTPLSVDSVASSYFEGLDDDAVTFDHALLMADIDHEWRQRESLCATPA